MRVLIIIKYHIFWNLISRFNKLRNLQLILVSHLLHCMKTIWNKRRRNPPLKKRKSDTRILGFDNALFFRGCDLVTYRYWLLLSGRSIHAKDEGTILSRVDRVELRPRSVENCSQIPCRTTESDSRQFIVGCERPKWLLARQITSESLPSAS